jgi:hypothetical protein
VEVNTLRDNSREIRFKKVFEWCLPMYGDDEESLSEYQAARMRNYMRKQIVEDGWTPKYYTWDKVITADHVTRFYGACLAKMFMGNRSINRIPVMAPILAPLLGIHFFRGHISLNNGTFCPLLATIQALSRARAFLLG